MNSWLLLRTFIAVFLTAFGLGLIFVRSGDERLMIGAFLFVIGVQVPSAFRPRLFENSDEWWIA